MHSTQIRGRHGSADEEGTMLNALTDFIGYDVVVRYGNTQRVGKLKEILVDGILLKSSDDTSMFITREYIRSIEVKYEYDQ